MARPAAPPCRATTAWRARSRPTRHGWRSPPGLHHSSRWREAPSWRTPRVWSQRWRPESEPRGLPCDGALLRRVHILLVAALEEERFHVLGEEAACLRIHDIQSVMVDQHSLLLHPLPPALLAETLHDAGADRAGKRRTLEAGACLAAAYASDSARHGTSSMGRMPNLYRTTGESVRRLVGSRSQQPHVEKAHRRLQVCLPTNRSIDEASRAPRSDRYAAASTACSSWRRAAEP